MNSCVALTGAILLGALLILGAVNSADSGPVPSMHKSQYMSEMESEPDPQYVLEMLSRLGQSIIAANDMENNKRGLDLGMSRGFSGSQAAKHLMGLAAANYAGGPGRKRRAAEQTDTS